MFAYTESMEGKETLSCEKQCFGKDHLWQLSDGTHIYALLVVPEISEETQIENLYTRIIVM